MLQMKGGPADVVTADEQLRAFLLEAENWLARHADAADPGAVRLLAKCRELLEDLPAALVGAEVEHE